MANYAMIAKDDLAVEFAKNVTLKTWAGEAFEILGEMQENHTDYWIVGRQVGCGVLAALNQSPFGIKKSDTIVICGIENVDRERMKLFAELTGYDITAAISMGEKMITKCHLCGHPQETFVLDDVKLKYMTKFSHISLKEIKKVKWKYVCNECTGTKRYWEWARTEAANGHIALKADAKIDIGKNAKQN